MTSVSASGVVARAAAVRSCAQSPMQQGCHIVSLRAFAPRYAEPQRATTTRRAVMCSVVGGNGNGVPYYGPAPPPKKEASADEVPDWVQDLINDAPFDEEVAELLQGTNNDPEKIREKMRASMEAKRGEIYGARSMRMGSDTQMRVRFREVEPTSLWLWMELYSAPSDKEKQTLEEVMKAWFMLGRLGGFNGMNLQVFHHGEDDASYFEYDHDECDETMDAYMHDMSNLETRGEWARVWVDMGTTDEMALDVLINSLTTLSRENLGIRTLVIGGENDDWPVPDRMGDEGRDAMREAMERLRAGKSL